MVVGTNLMDETARMQAQIMGVFFTAVPWVHKAMRGSQNMPPEGVSYSGLRRTELLVYLSARLRGSKALEIVVDTIRALSSGESAWKLKLLTNHLQVIDVYKSYVAARGDRSRPAGKIAAVCLNDDDRRHMQSTTFKECASVVQTFNAFLLQHSHVDRDVVCGGVW